MDWASHMRASAVLLRRSSCALEEAEADQNLRPLRWAAFDSVVGASASRHTMGKPQCSFVACTARWAKLAPGFAGCFCSNGAVQHGKTGRRKDHERRTASMRWSIAVLAHGCVVWERLGQSVSGQRRPAVAGCVLYESGHHPVTWSCHVLL
jgi:hypothetical protein